MSESEIVIASAARTAVGAFNGAFANAHPPMSSAVPSPSRRRFGARQGRRRKRSTRSFIGQILTAGEGQNPGPPGIDRKPACRRRRLPGGSTSSVGRACSVRRRSACSRSPTGDAKIIVAGGQESHVHGAALRLAHPGRCEDGRHFEDGRHHDQGWSLMDAFNGYHMGNDRRERGARSSRLTSGRPGQFCGLDRRTRPKPRTMRAGSRTRLSLSPVKSRKGDIGRRSRTSTISGTAPPSIRSPS